MSRTLVHVELTCKWCEERIPVYPLYMYGYPVVSALFLDINVLSLLIYRTTLDICVWINS